MDSEQEIQRLIRDLQDKDDVLTRYHAAEALGEVQDPRTINPLIESLMDINPSVRTLASMALGKIALTTGLNSITTHIQDYFSRESRKGLKPAKKTRNNMLSAMRTIMRVLRDNKERFNKEKISVGKPKPPVGDKKKVIRIRRKCHG